MRIALGGLSLLLLAGCSSPPSASEEPTPTASITAAPSTPSAPSSGSPGGSGSAGAPGSSGAPGAEVPTDPTPRVASTVATDLEVPWGLAQLPDGSVLVTTRDDARLWRVDVGSARRTGAGRVPGVDSMGSRSGEGGLLGVAVSPTFESDSRIFVYYTTATDNRIATSVATTTAAGTQRWTQWEPILTSIPRAGIHNGGQLQFGPDGMLYASTGDAGNGALAQDEGSLGGKILRMTPTGGVPADNPDAGSLTWSMGHRNVQGLAFDAEGRLWASEFGNRSADELNLIKPGQNYGWPVVEGPSKEKRFTNPIASWPTDVVSPSSIAVTGDYVWMAALRGNRLWRVTVAEDGSVVSKTETMPVSFFEGDFGRLRTVMALGPDRLLLGTSNRDGRGDPAGNDDRLLLITLE